MTVEEFKFLYRRPLEKMAIRLRPLNAPGQTGPVTDDEIDVVVTTLQAHSATDAMYREEARQRRLEQVAWNKKQEDEREHTAITREPQAPNQGSWNPHLITYHTHQHKE